MAQAVRFGINASKGRTLFSICHSFDLSSHFIPLRAVPRSFHHSSYLQSKSRVPSLVDAALVKKVQDPAVETEPKKDIAQTLLTERYEDASKSPQEKGRQGLYRIRRIIDPRGSPRYHIYFGSYNINLQVENTKHWDIDLDRSRGNDLIHIEIDVSEGPHENPWAKFSIKSDDAARVGIRATYRDYEPVWLQSTAAAAVAMANSLFDWTTGQVLDVPTHNWGADRYPFMGTLRLVVSRSSWRSTLGPHRDPETPKLTGSGCSWMFTKVCIEAFEALKARSKDPTHLEIIDYAFRHHAEFGYFPGGLFASHIGSSLTLFIRKDAELVLPTLRRLLPAPSVDKVAN